MLEQVVVQKEGIIILLKVLNQVEQIIHQPMVVVVLLVAVAMGVVEVVDKMVIKAVVAEELVDIVALVVVVVMDPKAMQPLDLVVEVEVLEV